MDYVKEYLHHLKQTDAYRAEIYLRQPAKALWKIYGCKYAGCILWKRRKHRRVV